MNKQKKNLRRPFSVKLKSLYIQKYKNLAPITINFESGNGLTMLVGNNGSGKSNVLEAISGIFHDLFKGKDSRKIKCDYKLQYTLNEINCVIEQTNGFLRCYGPKFKRREYFIEENAPHNIIGLYSGEENRLWTSFYETYYKSYIKRIKTNRHQERMRLMLINKYYWNVALLTLLLSSNETLKPFIENDLGITSISTIELKFNFKYFDDVNELLKTFINRINPDHKSKIECNLEDLRNSIFYSVLTDENGNILVDENGNKLLAEIGITDTEVFQNLTQAYMPKNEKIIKDIIIQIDDDITVEQLSEGEKKLILVKTVLEILSDEKTLVLMDEPDAHLHEGRKPALCNMMREYPNRQIVIATHSPIMAQIANEKELLMLELENGKSTILTDEKIEKIKKLSGTSWDVIGQGMMLKSNRPLVVFEGKTDVKYVKRAIDLLKNDNPSYDQLQVDFMSAGGADNMQFFITDLLEVIPNSKKVIVFFDRDNEGQTGAATLLNLTTSDEAIAHYDDVKQNNLTVSFIPYKTGVTGGDFLIEDYFSWDKTVKPMVDKAIENSHHPFKNLPKLSSRIKKGLEDKHMTFAKEEFEGFITLLDKIVKLSAEEGT